MRHHSINAKARCTSFDSHRALKEHPRAENRLSTYTKSIEIKLAVQAIVRLLQHRKDDIGHLSELLEGDFIKKKDREFVQHCAWKEEWRIAREEMQLKNIQSTTSDENARNSNTANIVLFDQLQKSIRELESAVDFPLPDQNQVSNKQGSLTAARLLDDRLQSFTVSTSFERLLKVVEASRSQLQALAAETKITKPASSDRFVHAVENNVKLKPFYNLQKWYTDCKSSSDRIIDKKQAQRRKAEAVDTIWKCYINYQSRKRGFKQEQVQFEIENKAACILQRHALVYLCRCAEREKRTRILQKFYTRYRFQFRRRKESKEIARNPRLIQRLGAYLPNGRSRESSPRFNGDTLKSPRDLKDGQDPVVLSAVKQIQKLFRKNLAIRTMESVKNTSTSKERRNQRHRWNSIRSREAATQPLQTELVTWYVNVDLEVDHVNATIKQDQEEFGISWEKYQNDVYKRCQSSTLSKDWIPHIDAESGKPIFVNMKNGSKMNSHPNMEIAKTVVFKQKKRAVEQHDARILELETYRNTLIDSEQSHRVLLQNKIRTLCNNL